MRKKPSSTGQHARLRFCLQETSDLTYTKYIDKNNVGEGGKKVHYQYGRKLNFTAKLVGRLGKEADGAVQESSRPGPVNECEQPSFTTVLQKLKTRNYVKEQWQRQQKKKTKYQGQSPSSTV